MTKRNHRSEHTIWEKIVYFFPVQLMFVHLKKNLVLLLFWLLLFAIVLQLVSIKYGVPYLFLFPEYLESVNFMSHFIVGISLGAFVMAFNLSSYVVNGFRFPFLATLTRPFIKYCQNNVLIPAIFSLVYLIALVQFQIEYERVEPFQVGLNVLGFLLGNLIFISITAIYFIATNRSSADFPDSTVRDHNVLNPVNDLFSNRGKWKKLERKSNKEWRVLSYISKWGHISLARDSSHYRQETLEQVFAQNRINASVFQIGVISSLFILGWFSNTSWLMIPAAASIMLFFTILIMLTSALYSWFKGWTSLALLGLLVSINGLSKWEPFQYRNQAYGMDYNTEKANYNQETIRLHQLDDETYKEDVKSGLRYLENWKEKQSETSPVAVFINVPGGGLRSAAWALHALHAAQVKSDNALWPKTLLISGSSGGMVGASYLREYFYRQLIDGVDRPADSLFSDISKDKLNAVAATAVMNDLFFRFKTFEWKGKKYTLDRASAFEQKLNQDTKGWLDRRLSDYKLPEHNAEMPMLVLAPTISNDGRKLIIASQGVSYMAYNTNLHQINENVEYSRFFSAQNADSLSFLSAIRMSATFPYVFPAANLPSNPSVEILDAGIRDNYGIGNTLKFIYTFRHWLKDNTKELVIVLIRDQQKFIDKPDLSTRSLFESIAQPLGTFYNTVLDIQDYQMEDDLRLAYQWYDGKITVIELVLERSENNPISLSWHLTKKEKERILNSVESDFNKHSFNNLKSIISTTE